MATLRLTCMLLAAEVRRAGVSSIYSVI